CLVLVDPDAHLSGGLDPIEIDLPRAAIRPDNLSKSKGNVAHLIHVGTADAVLHWPSNRRPEFQRNCTGHCSWEVFLEHPFELLLNTLPGIDILRNNDKLIEELIRQLNAERKIKSDRAASNIGAPLFDVR